MRRATLIFFLANLFLAFTPTIHAQQSAISPWPENRWYWQYKQQPVLLLGATDDDNLFQWPEKKLISHLDELVAAGGNVIRNTMSDRKDQGFEIYAYKKIDAKKYDLNQWNEEYWERFERMLEETKKRDIIVQIEIWDRFDYTDVRGSNFWRRHPYNPRNNINYSYKESTFRNRYPHHPSANKQPFFYTTPRQRNNQVILPYQKRYVDKLLDYTLRYNHVLYCLDNETSAQKEWAHYWARYLINRSNNEKKKIYITEMWGNQDITDPQHHNTFNYPALFDFVDVSQNNHNKGQEHWNNFIYVRNYLSKKPRPINTTKIYGADGNDYGHNDQDGIERFWRHLLGGGASVRFHRPPGGLGLSEKSVATLKAARKLESKIPLWKMRPANEFLSKRLPNEAYLAASKTNDAYALYFPKSGSVSLDLTAASGLLHVYWINIETGEWGEEQEITGGQNVTFANNGPNNWIAAIVAED